MATIRKRGAKWQVQIRRVGVRPLSRSFNVRKDAEAWARFMEVQADRNDLPDDQKALQQVTLGELVARYRDTITVKKRGAEVERIVLAAFMRHSICRRRLSEIVVEDFAAYRDERLRTVKPSSLKREFLSVPAWCHPTLAASDLVASLQRDPLVPYRGSHRSHGGNTPPTKPASQGDCC